MDADGLFYREGNARVTLFAGQSNANTFDYEPGDIGYVPAAYGKRHCCSYMTDMMAHE
jgi:oxalate decarboxylase/phosphoglucose isomerase-like protein (cupin superfamily)